MSDVTEGSPSDADAPTSVEPAGLTGDGVLPATLPSNLPAAGGTSAPPEMSLAQGWLRLKSAEQFWYVLQCIAFGVGYFAKIPTKKALKDAGLAEMTSAEQFWYVLQCIAFGVGYFAKIPTKKALSDAGLLKMKDAEQFWYVLQCISFASGYMAKVVHKKALTEAALLPRPGA